MMMNHRNGRSYSLRVKRAPLHTTNTAAGRTHAPLLKGTTIDTCEPPDFATLPSVTDRMVDTVKTLSNGDVSFKLSPKNGRRFSLFTGAAADPDLSGLDERLSQPRLSLRRVFSPTTYLNPVTLVDPNDDSHGDIGYAKYPKEKDRNRLDANFPTPCRSGSSRSSIHFDLHSGATTPLDRSDNDAELTCHSESDRLTLARNPPLKLISSGGSAPLTSVSTYDDLMNRPEDLTGRQIRPNTLLNSSLKAKLRQKTMSESEETRLEANDTRKQSLTVGIEPRRQSLSPCDSPNIPKSSDSLSKTSSHGSPASKTLATANNSVDIPDRRPLTSSLYGRSRFSMRKPYCRRLVHKDGYCNVSHINVPKQKRKFLRDIFTTMIDVKWRWSLSIFTAAFLLSWTTFALLYFIISYLHGDFDDLPVVNTNQTAPTAPISCISNAHSFSSVFLFAVETQTTIGYGFRYVTDECPGAMMLVCLQSIFGIMVQSFMTGFIFAKLARPKKRAETLIFSKNAVICMRDGRLCLQFRVGDMRKSHIVECHIRLQMIKKMLTAEGELLPFHQFDMNVGFDTGLDRIFLVWPITICHVINEDSPLYEYSSEDLLTARFEIVAILEGIVESTGMTTQARTSYLPGEILWGHRLEKLVTYQRDNGAYRIDFNRFHSTYPVETPSGSAKEVDELREAGVSPDRYRTEEMEMEEEFEESPSPAPSLPPSNATQLTTADYPTLANGNADPSAKDPNCNSNGFTPKLSLPSIVVRSSSYSSLHSHTHNSSSGGHGA